MLKNLRMLLQWLFLELSRVGVNPGNLLKLGVEIYSYNDHLMIIVRLSRN